MGAGWGVLLRIVLLGRVRLAMAADEESDDRLAVFGAVEIGLAEQAQEIPDPGVSAEGVTDIVAIVAGGYFENSSGRQAFERRGHFAKVAADQQSQAASSVEGPGVVLEIESNLQPRNILRDILHEINDPWIHGSTCRVRSPLELPLIATI